MDSLISSSGSLKSSGTTSRPSSCPALGTPVTGGPILFGPKDALCRSYTKGSPCVSGGWRDQQFNQRTQQRFAPFSNIVNELKEPQVKRQLLLRNPPVRSEPRPQQRPKALNRVDMDFAKSIPILVAGELPGRVTHGVETEGNIVNCESDPGKLGSLSVSSYSPYSMKAIHYVPLGPST